MKWADNGYLRPYYGSFINGMRVQKPPNKMKLGMEESLVSLKAKPNFISTFNQVYPLHK